MKKLLLIPVILHLSAAFAQDSTHTRIPFEGMDLGWINGQNRQQEFPLKYKNIVTAGVYLDAYYNANLARPVDHTHNASATMGRSGEFMMNLVSAGLDVNYKNTIAKLWIQTGNSLHLVQETDATAGRGTNSGTDNLKHIREASAGYHFNKWYGINVEMGIFSSYIGMESYLTQENWTYQRSMLSDFTPFYFQGARVQVNPTARYQAQLWLVNGWQSYYSWNNVPGIGLSNLYRPNENIQLSANFYYGKDTRDPELKRFHHDNGLVIRYLNKNKATGISQSAFSINTHYGFQAGDTIDSGNHYILGTSVSHRTWFYKNKTALTLHADYLTNPGLYLVIPPANTSPNNFTDAIAGSRQPQLNLFQATATFDIMPNDLVTFRIEYGYRQSNVPYFAGRGGTTSPDGWQGTAAGTWRPDLKKEEHRITLAVNFRL